MNCSTKETNASALVLERRPVGHTADRLVGGKAQSSKIATTFPNLSSGEKFHSEDTANPISPFTASRTPSAAVTFNRPWRTTDTSAVAFRNVQDLQESPPPPGV